MMFGGEQSAWTGDWWDTWAGPGIQPFGGGYPTPTGPGFGDNPRGSIATEPGVNLGVNINLGGGTNYRATATDVVNYYEPLLAANRDAYLSGQRNYLTQQAALHVFDSTWAEMVSQLAQLGAAGQAGIADRQPGGQWDWFAYYRDPIAADRQMTSISNPGNWLILAGVAVAILLLVKVLR